jgi:RNA polymerase sigma-70 factor, ECF subfamily
VSINDLPKKGTMVGTSVSLLEQIRSGTSNQAWQRWHALYEPLIQEWLRQHRLVPVDRDDVTQNTLAVVVRKIPEFQHTGRVGAFRHWLKCITINCLRDYWKQRRQHPQAGEAFGTLDQWEDDRSDLSLIWEREHDRHIVHKLTVLLKPEFAEETWLAFHGVVIEAKQASVVAAELQISANAVYIAKSRVLTRLCHVAAGLVDIFEHT